MTEPTIRVTTQGHPVVNGAIVRVQHDDIALVEVDMKTKHCQVGIMGEADGIPFVAVAEWPDQGEYTHTAFPAFAGWTVEVADCGRYTVRGGVGAGPWLTASHLIKLQWRG